MSNSIVFSSSIWNGHACIDGYLDDENQSESGQSSSPIPVIQGESDNNECNGLSSIQQDKIFPKTVSYRDIAIEAREKTDKLIQDIFCLQMNEIRERLMSLQLSLSQEVDQSSARRVTSVKPGENQPNEYILKALESLQSDLSVFTTNLSIQQSKVEHDGISKLSEFEKQYERMKELFNAYASRVEKLKGSVEAKIEQLEVKYNQRNELTTLSEKALRTIEILGVTTREKITEEKKAHDEIQLNRRSCLHETKQRWETIKKSALKAAEQMDVFLHCLSRLKTAGKLPHTSTYSSCNKVHQICISSEKN